MRNTQVYWVLYIAWMYLCNTLKGVFFSPKSHKTKKSVCNVVSMQIILVLCALVWGISFWWFLTPSQYNGFLYVLLVTLKNNIHETQQQHVFPETMPHSYCWQSADLAVSCFYWNYSLLVKHSRWNVHRKCIKQVTNPTRFIWCERKCHPVKAECQRFNLVVTAFQFQWTANTTTNVPLSWHFTTALHWR